MWRLGYGNAGRITVVEGMYGNHHGSARYGRRGGGYGSDRGLR